MKKFLTALAAALFVCCGSAGAQSPQQHFAARYFMQGEADVVSKVPYGNNPATGHYVQAGDAKIYYEVYGKGEPVLVLHGGGVGASYEMGRFVDLLQKKYQVIAVSTRGHGKSEIGSEAISHKQRADDALAALLAVTDRPAIVLGFSDGAYSGYKLASLYPEKVKKLIAIGAGENVPALRQIVPAKVEDVRRMDPAFMDLQLSLAPEPERLQAYWDDFYSFYNRLVVSKELYNSIKCPVLLIVGEKDPNAPLATVLAAYQMIPNARLAVIADAPHQAFITNFAAVWANIEPFLKD